MSLLLQHGRIQGVRWVRTNPLRDKEIFFEAIVVGWGLNLVHFLSLIHI